MEIHVWPNDDPTIVYHFECGKTRRLSLFGYRDSLSIDDDQANKGYSMPFPGCISVDDPDVVY